MLKKCRIATLLQLPALVLSVAAFGQEAARSTGNWPMTGGGPGNSHYSSLSQIDRSNVSKLTKAWSFETGEPGGLETTPVVVDGVLYAFTPKQEVIALNGANGRLLWKFDSGIAGTGPNRGITYWTNGKEKRLLAGIMNFVYALDPPTGKVISTFGKNGRIDLRDDLGRDPSALSVALTSPGVIYKDLLIVGGRNPETLPAPPGDIRAYDVRTGSLRWSFHTIPHPGEFGYDTWPKDAWKLSGAANNWAGMAIDEQRGIIFVPTGSAAPDFYGASRLGDDLFANSLIALDAESGKRLWHFQGVHHDIWDRDFPAPPVLVSVIRNGKDIPAVAQTTKQGTLYVFNRLTGESLFPIENRHHPSSTVPGEIAAVDQPFPLRPAPFARQTVTEETLTTRTASAHEWAVKSFRQMRSNGQFVPLSVGNDTIVTPSFEGGAEWGGPALDPRTNVIYINANNYASIGALAAHSGSSPGRSTYLSQCSLCHGEHRTGSVPEFPSLLSVTDRFTPEEITKTIHQGRGRMPAFPNIQGDQLRRLLDYLHTEKDLAPPDTKASEEQTALSQQELKAPTRNTKTDAQTQGSADHSPDTQYAMTGYRRFLDPDGYPAVSTPWGTLNALDLNTGEYLWQIPLGQYPELVEAGMPDTGSENYGGPIVTAGGLLFIGATNFDKKFRAFDESTGGLLWETTLPFAGNATPASYEVDGRQYVVIAAGGSSMNPRGPTGGVYVAFALPRSSHTP